MGTKRILYAMSAVLLVSAALSGCATTPGHSCPLDHGFGCHSVQQAYSAAVNDRGTQQYVFNRPGAHPAAAPVASPSPFAQPSSAGYPQGGPGGTPVWTPGQVYRAWTAPWTDAEGYLHSGGYVYFTTPGHWSYGTLHATGPGAGVLHPIAPSELGFTPEIGKRIMPNQKHPGVDSATKSAVNYINGDITQPEEQMTP